MEGDPRLIPARPDLAALHLRDQVEAEEYASGREMRVTVPAAPMTAARDADGEMTTQLLFGEDFTAYEIDGGWAWGQAALDNYVGYVPEACLSPAGPAPTHRVVAAQALVYPEPALKSRPMGALPFGSRVGAGEVIDGFAALDVGGWTPASAVAPVGDKHPLWVATAERFLGAPYLWGGRSPAGFDCSGLIQIALQAAGVACPRDSDMQFDALGRSVSGASLRRGDIVFWRGHVGVMLSPKIILHANAHHMEVAKEAFETAASRIADKEFGDVIGVKRITV